MSRWILPFFGFLCFPGLLTLQAQIPKNAFQKTVFPPTSNPSQVAPRPQQMPQMAQPAQASTDTPQVIAITAESMELLDNTRKLTVGDRLSFRIVQDREDARPLSVTEMGEVEFPMIGRVKAVDKTLKQLAYEVKQLMDREYYYNATVLIGLDAGSRFRGRIYVIGAVNGVGPQDIPSDEVFTVSKAILRAGGFSDFANQRKVKLVRKGAPGGAVVNPDAKADTKDGIIVDCKAIYSGDTTAVDPVLLPDDMIVVPQRLINF